MLRALLKPVFEKFGNRYDYNVDYMSEMDEGSPGVLAKMALMNPLSSHNKVAPKEAYYIAKLVSTHYHDCGPCLRLVCNMAAEAGVGRSLILQTLQAPQELPDNLAEVAAYAQAVVAQDHAQLAELQPRMKSNWSQGAIAEISLAIAFGGFYPMMKRGLGSATACEPVVNELRQQLGAHA